jgi:hypothetical protein
MSRLYPFFTNVDSTYSVFMLGYGKPTPTYAASICYPSHYV